MPAKTIPPLSSLQSRIVAALERTWDQIRDDADPHGDFDADDKKDYAANYLSTHGMDDLAAEAFSLMSEAAQEAVLSAAFPVPAPAADERRKSLELKLELLRDDADDLEDQIDSVREEQDQLSRRYESLCDRRDDVLDAIRDLSDEIDALEDSGTDGEGDAAPVSRLHCSHCDSTCGDFSLSEGQTCFDCGEGRMIPCVCKS